jgi:pyruvate/2-oxoglutarate dehydrogenase complex dihydrolipoamide dehydrogenase (E3) component
MSANDILKVDLCIIGAGSAGLSLAAGAAQMGANVVLIEGAEMGGDCLNAGCIPSKALLAAAHVAHSRRHGTSMGIAAAKAEVDFAAVKDHVAAVIAGIAPHDSQERFEGLGVTVIRDWARFTGPDSVAAGGKTIRARRFVVATGSRAFVPPVPGIDSVPYLTNETIFALRDRPDHLIVLGGGPIGVEMAQAHCRLGSAVSIVEAGRCLARDDADAAALVLDSLRGEGIIIHEGHAAARIAATQGGVEVVLADGTTITGSHLLVAAGRVVSLDRLDLKSAGVEYDRRGVTVGANLRSVSNRRVYAMGDAAGGLQFTHLAGAHAGTVLRQTLLGLPAKGATLVPWVTYADPELAQVGPPEAEARKLHGDKLEVIRVEVVGNDRAQTEGETHGFLKVMVVGGRPIGATMVGKGAGDLIGIWCLAIGQRLKLSAIAGTILPYPTRGEIAKRMAGAYYAPRLFANPWLKRLVRTVQRLLP